MQLFNAKFIVDIFLRVSSTVSCSNRNDRRNSLHYFLSQKVKCILKGVHQRLNSLLHSWTYASLTETSLQRSYFATQPILYKEQETS